MTFWMVKRVTREGPKMATIQHGVKPDIFKITLKFVSDASGIDLRSSFPLNHLGGSERRDS